MEDSPALDDLLAWGRGVVAGWEGSFGEFAHHPSLAPSSERLGPALEEFSARMQGNFPFFHPSFAGQMLKPPHPVAAAGYLAAMLVNPNNHALDGGPVTSEMEKEVVSQLAAMFRLPGDCLGHLTSGGTVANLEALWVGRELSPEKRVVYGTNAHYTHGRMCSLLRVPATAVGVDATGRLDLAAVERCCREGDVGTVVLTAGTTGLGLVDPVSEALQLKERYGVRLHVDAAYGGFFSVLAWSEEADAVPADDLRAIACCDSVVVDPHKHGLQPYGCGAVLFADPSVGRLYKHDSPYTYFTSERLHLGEISLECSRAGAAAAALWLTLKVFPLSKEGLGPVLAACRRAATSFAERLAGSDALRLFIPPELDIVTYFPWREGASGEEISRASKRVLSAGMTSSEPVWLSTLRVEPAQFAAQHARVALGSEAVTLLRSVLMKPEHASYADELVSRVEELARASW